MGLIRQPSKLKKVSIKVEHLLELVHWARRYADRRCTFVPREFNTIHKEIFTQYEFLRDLEFVDQTLTEDGRFFPYAQDGMYEENQRIFDATASVKNT